jgi:hypothetical protein
MRGRMNGFKYLDPFSRLLNRNSFRANGENISIFRQVVPIFSRASRQKIPTSRRGSAFLLPESADKHLKACHLLEAGSSHDNF